VVVLCLAGHGAAGDWAKQTVAYKTVGATRIDADVYRRNGEQVRPVVAWLHGGALISGDRDSVPSRIADLCRSNNYVLISLDYRLAPAVKLPAIIEDLQDAFAWIRDQGRRRFFLDPDRMVVAGGSAGGYLTMMTGICVKPPPRALLTFWGYGDINAPWYTMPSAHYRKLPLVGDDEARRVVEAAAGLEPRSEKRRSYYLYLRQNGLWTKAVSGFDPSTQHVQLDCYCPVRNITPRYPPTLMIHGTADDDVPYEESAKMAAALAAQGVWHELVTVANGGHGLGGAGDEAIRKAHARALEFIHDQLE
jgi:acetyl esterase/lipase